MAGWSEEGAYRRLDVDSIGARVVVGWWVMVEVTVKTTSSRPETRMSARCGLCPHDRKRHPFGGVCLSTGCEYHRFISDFVFLLTHG